MRACLRKRSRQLHSIATLADVPKPQEVQEVVERLEKKEIIADGSTYARLLRACGRIGALSEGRRVHSHINQSSIYRLDSSLSSHVVQMYLRCHSLQDARNAFQSMPCTPGVVLWTAIIAAYAKHGQKKEALSLFKQMQRHHVLPDKITFVAILDAFDSSESLAEAKAIHARISEAGYEDDLIVANALVKMYSACDSIQNAQQVFEKMQHRDVVTWTAMIAANAKNGHLDNAVKLFRQMQLRGVAPNKVTFLALLNCCELPHGQEIHVRIISAGLQSDVALGNALLNMYGRCGQLNAATKLFREMRERTTVTWTTMMAAFVQHGNCEEALQLFREMQDERVKADKIAFTTILNACTGPEDLCEARYIHGCIIRSGFESDLFIANALIKTYSKCGSLMDAYRTFTEICYKDPVSWTSMIAAYSTYNRLKKSVEFFQQMQLEGFSPNDVTLLTMINACASRSSLKEGKMIHGYVCERGLETDVVVGTALVDLYGKCGEFEEALGIFKKLDRADVVSWTSLIAAYAQHGHANQATKLFWKMHQQGMRPVAVTFVSIISACSRAGLLETGIEFFDTMVKDHRIGIVPEHYGCMVDLFGRSGRLEEAEYLIDTMPCKPTQMAWMAFLGACKLHGDANRGQRAAAQILGLDPKTAAAVATISNTYSPTGSLEDVDNVRKLILGCLKGNEQNHLS